MIPIDTNHVVIVTGMDGTKLPVVMAANLTLMREAIITNIGQCDKWDPS